MQGGRVERTKSHIEQDYFFGKFTGFTTQGTCFLTLKQLVYFVCSKKQYIYNLMFVFILE